MAGNHDWSLNEVVTSAYMNGYVRDQLNTIVTSGSRPTTTQTGRVITEADTARQRVWNGSAWIDLVPFGAWDTWLPVWTQGGTNPTFTNLASRYTRIGKTITAQSHIQLTSNGTASQPWTCTLPAPALATLPDTYLGTWFHDNTSGSRLSGTCLVGTGNLVYLVASTGTLIGAEAPYSGAVASTHKWGFQLTYEAN